MEDLLELSKLDAKQIRPKPEQFSLSELTQDVVLKFKPKAEKQHITIHTNFPIKIPIVEADIGMIERALSNLLDNALIYTPEKGEVSVVVEEKDKKVSVKVSDNGKGIPENDLPHVFDRFYRGDKSRTTEGTGLGLAITKKIIEAHQSEISVQSKINKGTAFVFDLQKPVLNL
jgi:signal transduction histidine kinase